MFYRLQYEIRNLPFFDFLNFLGLMTLIQGQENVLTLRVCAQSISRLENPLYSRFSSENSNLIHFRFNTPTTLPESELGKHFRASGMSKNHKNPLFLNIQYK